MIESCLFNSSTLVEYEQADEGPRKGGSQMLARMRCSGIGAAIARKFSENGYFVFLLGRSADKLAAVQKTCVGPTQMMAFDLKNLEATENLLVKNLQACPPLEILINNAGIYHRQSFDQTLESTWCEQFEINLLAPVRLTRILWPTFVKNKKGSILNISSTLGLKPAPETSAYSAMKAALNNWTFSLAQEGGAYNIRANAICPGIVDTPIHSFHHLDPAEKSRAVLGLSSLQLLSPIGLPAQIAEAAYFLASDLSSWTTGSLLSVDGGINIK